MIEFRGFFGEIAEYLCGLTNSKISDKMKLEYPTERAYFKKRAEIENELILRGINWQNTFESMDLRFPTEEDKAVVKTLSNQELMDFTIIMNLALRGYVDSFEEENEKCKILHEFYLLLKFEIELRPNLSFFPKGDGFLDYLESRDSRNKLRDKKLNARIEGTMCLFCEGTNIRSNGNMWHCLDCGKNFRKSKNLNN
jgi:hypothetical protein